MPCSSARLGVDLLLCSLMMAFKVCLMDGSGRNVALPKLRLCAACCRRSSQQRLLGCNGGPLPCRSHSLSCCSSAVSQLPLHRGALLLPCGLLAGNQHYCLGDRGLNWRERGLSAAVKWADWHA